MSLIKQLQKLEIQYAALDPPEEDRDLLNHQLTAFSNDFLNGIEELPAFNSNDQLNSDLAIDDHIHGIDDILKAYRIDVIEKGILASSGGHLGYIPGGGIYASSLADYLAAFSNEYAGVYYASPGAV
ncbi:MAG: hypothetical protein ACSHWU_11920, partial [Marinicella sp.]